MADEGEPGAKLEEGVVQSGDQGPLELALGDST
jgi:hypothetical protein